MAASLDALPPEALSAVGGFLDAPSVLALMHCSHATLDPDLLADKLAALPPHIPKPALRSEGARTTVAAAFPERHERVCELLAALAAGRPRREGVPAAGIAISWKDTPSYWEKDAPEGTSPYGRVDKLRSVCWLNLSGCDALASGDFACLLRVHARGFWGSSMRFELSAGDALARRFVTLTQAAPQAGGPTGPGLNSSQLPQRQWLWLFMGRARVHDAPLADGGPGSGGSGVAAAEPAAEGAPGAAAAFPPDGVRVAFRAWDHSGAWKAGLWVDHCKWVPWDDLPAVLTGERQPSAARSPHASMEVEPSRACPGGEEATASFMPAVPWQRGNELRQQQPHLGEGAQGATGDAPPAEHPAVASLLERGWAVQPAITYWSRTHPGELLTARGGAGAVTTLAAATVADEARQEQPAAGGAGGDAPADPAAGVQPFFWAPRFLMRNGRRRGAPGPGGAEPE